MTVQRGRFTKRSRLLTLILGCLLWAPVVLAAGAEKPVPGEAHELYDSSQWTAVKSATASFGKRLHAANVLLLKSIAATGSDGVGRPLYSVNLIVVGDGHILYSFASLVVPAYDARRADPNFCMDDVLELRDVTGDRVVEIIFHSGWRAASDGENVIHVLQYTDSGPAPFRDIRADSFAESRWWKFRWLDLHGSTRAVLAEPIEPSSDDPEVMCHGCPRFHRYLVYRWEPTRARFVLRETIPSTRKLHRDGEDPLQTDWSYIVAKVKKHNR